jgi:hypothetical protein
MVAVLRRDGWTVRLSASQRDNANGTRRDRFCPTTRASVFSIQLRRVGGQRRALFSANRKVNVSPAADRCFDRTKSRDPLQRFVRQRRFVGLIDIDEFPPCMSHTCRLGHTGVVKGGIW